MSLVSLITRCLVWLGLLVNRAPAAVPSALSVKRAVAARRVERRPPGLAQAMRRVAVSTGQLSGYVTPEALHEAYGVIGDILGYYARARVFLRESIPVCPISWHPVRWVFWIMKLAQTDLPTWWRAVLGGALLRVPAVISEARANEVEMRHGPDFMIVRARRRPGQRVACVHVRAADGRPLVLRGLVITGVHADGLIYVRDHEKGKIQFRTVRASGWRVCKGWLVPRVELPIVDGGTGAGVSAAVSAMKPKDERRDRQPKEEATGEEPGVAVVQRP